MLPRIATVALLWLLLAGAGTSPAIRFPAAIDEAIQRVTAAELRAHVEVLASDQLAGRAVGHTGNRDAARYIAQTLRAAKVSPASPGYLQAVEVYEPRLGSDGRLSITVSGQPLV